MISIHVDDQDALALLKSVYANRLNATSRGARYSMNTRKRRFMEAFRASARVEGEPVEGPLCVALFHFCLPRCDWDAGIKSTQDAVEIYLACRNDRVIKSAFTFLTRPVKGTKKRQGRKAFVHVELYSMETELDDALERARDMGEWSRSCWQSKS